MNRLGFIVLFVLISYNCCVPAYAFDDRVTHRKLTEASIAKSNINIFLIANIGFTEGIKKTFGGLDRNGNGQTYEINEWLQEGSEDEDHPLCRATNHFHNPIHEGDWTQSKMSDSILVPIYSFIVSCGTKYSNVTWATGFTAPISGFTARNGQEMGWDNARTYFYEALTATDPTVKEAKFVKTFKSVGMVTHLLQDVAVPAHVRNDMSSHLINSAKWGGNPFESYVIDHYAAISNTPVKPEFTVPIRLTDFWDNDSYTGDNPGAGKNQGLAEYANANFVSDYTLFKSPSWDLFGHSFKYPAESSTIMADTNIQDPLFPLDPSRIIPRKYYVKTGDGETNGGNGYKLAGVGYITAKVQGGKTGTTTKDLPPMDDYVHADYAQLLLPRTVGYSAALLDYFFRGTMTITTAPGDITFRSIKVTASNSTPSEAMATGDVSLVIRYKALTETDLGGGKFLLNNPSDDYSYKVVTLNNVDMANSQPLTFTFTDGPLPMNFSDMTMQLVYKGPLGNETDSVAVSPLITIDGIYTDFNLSLPASGVFAKVSGDSTNASFNELRVTALSNNPGGLSGGTISLALEYRTAVGDQFQSVLVNTEPENAAGYIIRTGEKNGVTTLAQGVPTELVFDLSSTPIPVSATDITLNLVYTDNATSKVSAVAVHDISEPTPVDVYNNTDYSCLNSTWYKYDDPAAMAIVDSNNDGKADRSDIYPHTISNISFLAGPAGSTLIASPQLNNLFASGPLPLGQKLRMGYILTEYANKFTFNETRTPLDANDNSLHFSLNTNYPGRGFQNDGDTQNMMYSFRTYKMWSGEGVIFINPEYNGSCTFDALNQKLGL